MIGRETGSQAQGPPFVGRDAELAALAGFLADAERGRGLLVALVGEAGVGKTRTLEEFVARTRGRAGLLLWGRCPESEGAPAYWPWLQALRAHFDRCDATELREELADSAPDLARLAPGLRDRLPDIAQPEALDPAQSRFRLFDAVASYLCRLSRRAPVVLVLDDVHWADPDSILLLEFLAREIRSARVLAIVTYRETEMRQRAGMLARLAQAARRVALHGLDREDVARFLRHSVGAASAPLLEELVRTTEGNPFFLSEVVRVLAAEGRIGAEPLAGGTLRLPDEVRGLIRRHMEPLADDERRLLAAAAVIGREFDLMALQHAFSLPADHVLSRRSAATASGIVDEVAGSVGRFRFNHALIRETLYGDLSAGERARLHRAIDQALEAQHGASAEPPLSELAHHFLLAAPIGEAERAVAYAARAGERAVALLAYEDAVGHFQRALDALALHGGDPQRARTLRLALGDARWRAGDYAGARATFEAAARLARAAGDPVALARAALGYSQATPEVGAVHTRLVELLEESLAALGPEDTPLRALRLGRLASALYFSVADQRRRQELSAEAVAMARRVGDPAALARALLIRQFVLWGPPGGLAARLAIGDEVLALAERAGDRQLALEGHGWRLLNLLEQGDLVTFDLQLDQYTRLCEQSRLPVRHWHARLVRATRALLAGRYPEAQALAAEAFSVLPPALESLHGQFFASQLFFPLLESGRLEELEPVCRFYAEKLPAVKMWRCTLALLHLRTGRAALARAMLEELAADGFAGLPRDGNFTIAVAELAEIAAATGDAARASALHALLEPWADANLVIGLTAGCLGSTHRYLGMLAATAGRIDEAAAHFEQALARNARLEAAVWLAYSKVEYAALLQRRGGAGDRERAAALLAEASRAASDLHLAALRRAIEAVGGEGAAQTEGEAAVPRRGTPAPGRTATSRGARAAPEAARRGGRRAAPPPSTVAGRAVARLSRDTGGWAIAVARAAPETASGQAAAQRSRDDASATDILRLRDTKGLAYLARLVAQPGCDVRALDLSRAGAGDAATAGAAPGGLDAPGREAYRERLAEIEEELAEAVEFNDAGHIDRLEEERERLVQELARAVGFRDPAGGGGTPSDDVDSAAPERARINVTRAIAKAVAEIARQSPALGRSLQLAVRTGAFCRYDPAPDAAVIWELAG